MVSNTQRDNVISVRLQNTQANEWNLEEDISFRENMSQAIVQFCGMSDLHLDLCNLTRDQLDDISVQTLPESPSQNGTDTILSFFVHLPGGTMPSDLLVTIFSSSPNVVSQPSSVALTIIQNPILTDAETENRVELSISRSITQDVRLDIQVSIAHRLNEYCRSNNSEAQLCPNTRSFTKDDIRVHIDRDTGNVSFVVIDPDTGLPLPVSQIQDAASGVFRSILGGLLLSVSPNTTSKDDDEEHDWPLILGLSIGGALLIVFVIVSIIVGVARNYTERLKYKVSGRSRASVYSGHAPGGWQFDRDSPYTGSPFEGIDAIAGFDDDDLPTNITMKFYLVTNIITLEYYA